MLALRGVEVRFGDLRAVADTDLDLAAGEMLALVGPSGCGKSTLLRAIAGLEPLVTGTISLDGDDISAAAPEARPFGLMFQDHALFPHRDVGRNVEFGLRMNEVAPVARRERVGELLELVGLAGYERRAVTTLSGGEAQRVALARALAPAPRVLLLDEPLGSLDRHLRDRLIDELPGVLEATGTAAIHVTHDHDEAFALGDRVGVMHDGRLHQTDRPAEVWAAPRSLVVARILGHTNVIEVPAGIEVWRSDAAVIDPMGDVEATVDRVHFRGVGHDVRLRTADGAGLRFVLPAAPAVGSTVRLRIDPERVIRFD
ncbi:MAG: ABC transporter [Acidimicrobiaceae bacterium]|nr:ABC transporter [Acidimicrobiaceae bacterium]